MIEKGKIIVFHGSWGSGLGILAVEDDNGLLQMIPCENAQTVRSLDACFGDVIGEGHCVNPESRMIGAEIFFERDFTLEWFCPVSEAEPELVRMYEKQFKKKKGEKH